MRVAKSSAACCHRASSASCSRRRLVASLHNSFSSADASSSSAASARNSLADTLSGIWNSGKDENSPVILLPVARSPAKIGGHFSMSGKTLSPPMSGPTGRGGWPGMGPPKGITLPVKRSLSSSARLRLSDATLVSCASTCFTMSCASAHVYLLLLLSRSNALRWVPYKQPLLLTRNLEEYKGLRLGRLKLRLGRHTLHSPSAHRKPEWAGLLHCTITLGTGAVQLRRAQPLASSS
mmetsp:Transcript_29485/g.67954  ORF Transcript_29485/g.67954 Transcript_29485/m.67954 type:complete len:236 (+) Transcript_29485:439-1146(+)